MVKRLSILLRSAYIVSYLFPLAEIVDKSFRTENLGETEENVLNTESTWEPGAYASQQSQVITDDFVESLLEIGSFFQPQGVVASPVEYVNDIRKAVPLETNVLLAEIGTQQILECGENLSIKLSGTILEGFAKPLEFSFFLSHTYGDAKVFRGRNNLQTFELSEYLRLEYPPIQLILTDTLFSLNFIDFKNDDIAPQSIFNGGGCLVFGETES